MKRICSTTNEFKKYPSNLLQQSFTTKATLLHRLTKHECETERLY